MNINFRSKTHYESPEINLIPFIDILLVILIFLLLTSNFNQMNILRIKLPQSAAQEEVNNKVSIHAKLSANGIIAINQQRLLKTDLTELTLALQQAAGPNLADTLLIIHADAQATHQAVISLMEAARNAGLGRISFATSSSNHPAR